MKKSFTQCFLIKAPIMVKKNYYQLKYGKKIKKFNVWDIKTLKKEEERKMKSKPWRAHSIKNLSLIKVERWNEIECLS